MKFMIIVLAMAFGTQVFSADLAEFVGDYKELKCHFLDGKGDGGDYSHLVWQVRQPDSSTLKVFYVDSKESMEPVERYTFQDINKGKIKTPKEESDWGCSKTERECKTMKNGVTGKYIHKGYLMCGPVPTLIHKDQFSLTSTKNPKEILIKFRGDSFRDSDCTFKKIN